MGVRAFARGWNSQRRTQCAGSAPFSSAHDGKAEALPPHSKRYRRAATVRPPAVPLAGSSVAPQRAT